ncbi:MAG TPA: hypothetical protein PKX40_20475 [Spirochaetota bacterium]|nr:hypothetical protein [Spirochaetota bacterium]
MKKLVALSVVFIAAALMAVGCEDKNDNKKEMATLMVVAHSLPYAEVTGSSQDISDAGSAAMAAASAMSQVRIAANPNGTTMMQSVMVDPNTPYVKGQLQQSILNAVNAQAVEKMKDVYGGCSGSQSANVHLSSEINGTGNLGGTYQITPDVDVAGTFKCNNSDAMSGSFDLSIKATGTITATYTNMHVQVLDVENYIANGTFVFKDVAVNGTVDITLNNFSTNMSFDYSVLPLPSLKLVVRNATGVTISSSDLHAGDNPVVAVDLTVAEEFNFRLSLLNISGSISLDVAGTVGGNDVSVSYRFSGQDMFNFENYVTQQVGYQM